MARHRVMIISVGSRGDAQPFVALGNKLIASGHDVAMATNKSHRAFVAQYGPDIEFLPFEGDLEAVLQSPEFEGAFFTGDTSEQMKVPFIEPGRSAG